MILHTRVLSLLTICLSCSLLFAQPTPDTRESLALRLHGQLIELQSYCFGLKSHYDVDRLLVAEAYLNVATTSTQHARSISRAIRAVDSESATPMPDAWHAHLRTLLLSLTELESFLHSARAALSSATGESGSSAGSDGSGNAKPGGFPPPPYPFAGGGGSGSTHRELEGDLYFAPPRKLPRKTQPQLVNIVTGERVAIDFDAYAAFAARHGLASDLPSEAGQFQVIKRVFDRLHEPGQSEVVKNFAATFSPRESKLVVDAVLPSVSLEQSVKTEYNKLLTEGLRSKDEVLKKNVFNDLKSKVLATPESQAPEVLDELFPELKIDLESIRSSQPRLEDAPQRDRVRPDIKGIEGLEERIRGLDRVRPGRGPGPGVRGGGVQ